MQPAACACLCAWCLHVARDQDGGGSIRIAHGFCTSFTCVSVDCDLQYVFADMCFVCGRACALMLFVVRASLIVRNIC